MLNRGDLVRVTFPECRPFVAMVVEAQAQGRTLVVDGQGDPLWVAARLCEVLGAEVLRARLRQVRACERTETNG